MSHNYNQATARELQLVKQQAITLRKEQRMEVVLGGIIVTVSIIACYVLLGGEPSFFDSSLLATSKVSMFK